MLPEFRTKRVIEILWQAIWNYVRAHNLDVMFGCASLQDPSQESLSVSLSYLQHFHLAPPEWLRERSSGQRRAL